MPLLPNNMGLLPNNMGLLRNNGMLLYEGWPIAYGDMVAVGVLIFAKTYVLSCVYPKKKSIFVE